MAKAYLQLTLYERRVIHESLDRRLSLKKIAATLGRSPSTISREVAANRTPKPPKGRFGSCTERKICVRSGVCGKTCPTPGEFCAYCKLVDCRMWCTPFRKSGKRCEKLDRFPYVCNGCRYSAGCTVRDRQRYVACEADTASKARRSDSRCSINMDAARADLVLEQIKDAIGRGMRPYEISVAYAASVGVSPSTIYRWIDKRYAGMANIELERKVGFRPRKGTSRPRPTRHSNKRSYASFCTLAEDVRASNQKGGCEKAHTELRQVLPKSTPVDQLTGHHMALAMSHVNSNPRKSLMGLSPIDVFLAAYGQDGQDFLDALGVEKIPADDLLLKPTLLDHEDKEIDE